MVLVEELECFPYGVACVLKKQECAFLLYLVSNQTERRVAFWH